MKAQATARNMDLTTTDGVKELEAHVQSRLGRHLGEFRLQLVEGGVMLRGRARTYYTKQLAQHAVMEATELPILANEIEVC